MIADTLMGVWAFLLNLTETAPLSVWQFVIAAIVPACMFRYMQRMPCTKIWNRKYGRDTVDWCMETAALMMGIAVAWVPWRTTAAVLIGICAGLLSPYLSKGVSMALDMGYRYLAARFPKTPQ